MTSTLAPALLALLLAQAPGSDAKPAPEAPCCEACAVPEAVTGITDRELGAHMKFLASDLMRGRDTSSPEIRIAAEYLASRLSAFGAEPVGDEAKSEGEGESVGERTYFQKFPLIYVTPKSEGTTLAFVVESEDARREIDYELNTDFSVVPYGLAPGEAEGPVLLAKPGENLEEALGDLDVQGKFVMVFREGERRNDRGFSSWRDEAAQRGALGILLARDPKAGPSEAIDFGGMRNFFDRPRMIRAERAASSIPTITLQDEARDGLLEAAGIAPEDLKPGDLPDVSAKFTFAADRDDKSDRNVVGLFPGSDPEKKNEVVIYSAHYDHVGVNDGEIYNGSDDNASGTSALLEIAEAFGHGPRPARSVAFLWVSGEEKGLLGSKYFSEHISLPEGMKIVADLNLDMVSRNDGNQVGITPSPNHPDYSTLIPAALQACDEEGIEALYDADQFYGRTDSYNFAKLGIPIVFFFSGVHEDYHRPTDDVAKADFAKAAKIARVAYRLGWRVANAPEAPHKIEPPAEEKADDAADDEKPDGDGL